MIHPTKLKNLQQGLAQLTSDEFTKLLDALDDIERTPPGQDWKKGEWRKRASTAFSPKNIQVGYNKQADKRAEAASNPKVRTKFSNWMNKTKNLFGGGNP